MNMRIAEENGVKTAVISPPCTPITDPQSALDFIMTVQYESGTNRIAIYKALLPEDFFILSTRLAGEILQKCINYHVKLAIIGDFSSYTSKPLHDFIYESNNGMDIFFVPTEEDAIKKLCQA